MSDLIDRQAAIDIVTPHDDNRAMRDALEELAPAQPGQDREFIKLVRNSNGRPYYSIIYLEFDDNGVGHDFEGYSSYSLDVISDYLKKYFMPPAQPQIIYCKDCRKHNKRIGFDENYHTVWKEDACPLASWRGKAQGHEFDYQYCAYGERREVTT